MLAQARELKINLSATLEQALKQEVKERQANQPFFVDVQNKLLDTLNSRVVIPLTVVDNKDKAYSDN